MKKVESNIILNRIILISFLIMLLFVFSSAEENPLPNLNSISPSTIYVGSDGFTMILSGENFISSTKVIFGDYDLSTTFLSSSELQAAVPKSYISNSGIFKVSVVNPAPGGGTSNVTIFSVIHHEHRIVSILPDTKFYGSSDLTLQVNGENISSNCVVRFNGIDRPTTFINDTKLMAELSPEDLSMSGGFEITVFNNSNSGGISNAVNLNVVYPVPQLESISPETKCVGDPAFTMTLSGTGFTPFSSVMFDDEELIFTYINSTTLQVNITRIYMLEPRQFEIVISNPLPGGGMSAPISFDVVVVQSLSISKITPAVKYAGERGFLMKVIGENFTPSTVGKIDGNIRPTTYLSSTEIIVSILDLDISTTGKKRINVAYPSLGGIESNSLIFLVVSPKSISDGNKGNNISSNIPDNYSLAQNYPNPFNPTTSISFDLPTTSIVTLKVYNSNGQLVESLLNQEELNAGKRSVNFNSSNLASGQYFYQMKAENKEGQVFSGVKQMIFIK